MSGKADPAEALLRNRERLDLCAQQVMDVTSCAFLEALEWIQDRIKANRFDHVLEIERTGKMPDTAPPPPDWSSLFG